jgi:hypothetical protein
MMTDEAYRFVQRILRNQSLILMGFKVVFHKLENSEEWNNAIAETDGEVAEICIRRKEFQNVAEKREEGE